MSSELLYSPNRPSVVEKEPNTNVVGFYSSRSFDCSEAQRREFHKKRAFSHAKMMGVDVRECDFGYRFELNDGRSGWRTTGDLVEEAEPYKWMFSWRDKDHRLEELIEMRETLESMYEKKTSFKPTKYFDSWYGREYQRAMLQYLGCWELPDRFQHGDFTSWVRPNGDDSVRYSDVASVCECGAVKYSAGNATLSHDYGDEHEDDCRPQHSLKTNAEVWDNRERILKQAALAGKSYKYVCNDRLGISRTLFTDFQEKLGVDYKAIKEHGLRRRRATFIKLNEEFGVSQREIAEAFGMSRQSVGDHIRGAMTYYD